jgi:phosphonate metabolism protein PhnN/1,5-bisphosphokinase (PRPP-forming)
VPVPDAPAWPGHDDLKIQSSRRMTRGTLFLVVGPSGAGKDTLIRAARESLDPASVVFARRVITRRAADPAEAFDFVRRAEFAARKEAGEFMLCWRAHGTDYGIAAHHEQDLAGGRSVVANVSRGVIAEAASRHAPVQVIEVTASPPVLASRLAARGREDGSAIAKRLRRAVALPDGVPTIRIVNDGALDDAVRAFVAALL